MKRPNSSRVLIAGLMLTAAVAVAQELPIDPPEEQGPPPAAQMQHGPAQFHGGPQGGPPQGPPQGGPQGGPQGQMPMMPARPPMERAMGRWWNNPQMVDKLGISADQKKKMEDTFQQYRLKLIDAKASLEKAEAVMEPLVAADTPDEAKIVAQIDKVAQARAELEKTNARMLLGIRQALTPEQWKKLQEQNGPQGPRPATRPQGQPGPRPTPHHN